MVIQRSVVFNIRVKDVQTSTQIVEQLSIQLFPVESCFDMLTISIKGSFPTWGTLLFKQGEEIPENPHKKKPLAHDKIRCYRRILLIMSGEPQRPRVKKGPTDGDGFLNLGTSPIEMDPC
jgi:hypothetical protein